MNQSMNQSINQQINQSINLTAMAVESSSGNGNIRHGLRVSLDRLLPVKVQTPKNVI